VTPIGTGRLASTVADLALQARTTAPPGRHAVRVGIDGPVQADGAALADLVATELERRAVPVARVRAVDFLRARSLRLEHGADDPESFLTGWYDLPALRREVLDPLGPGGTGRWLPRLRDPHTDRPYREPAREAPPGSVAVLDGRFLGGAELDGAIDVRVHLDVTSAGRARRVPADEHARVLPAWQAYLDRDDPAATATLAVRFDHPDRPALLGNPL
jgi:hypothetical protein